jgi:hypothetical protein
MSGPDSRETMTVTARGRPRLGLPLPAGPYAGPPGARHRRPRAPGLTRSNRAPETVCQST